MKNLILMTLALTIMTLMSMMTSSVVYASQVPLDWYQETNIRLKSNDKIERDAFQEELNFIFDTQLNALEENSVFEQSDKSIALPFCFKFSHYVTDFSVSRNGIFGFSALKAKSAVEIKWRKKKNKMVDRQQEATTILEFTDDSDEHFFELSNKIVRIVKSSGKLDMTAISEKNFNKNISRAMNDFKYMIRSITAENKEFKRWDLAALRLDLNIGASGKIFWVATAGASIRIRLEWKKIKKTKLSNKNHKRRVISNLTNKILYDLDTVLTDYRIGNFRVDKVNIGVGISYKGRFLGLAKAKTGFLAFLRFKPKKRVKTDDEFENENEDEPVHAEFADEDIEVVLDESELGEATEKGFRFFRLSRNKFRNGIRKSLRMVRFFANAADKKGVNWEVNGLKVVFDLQKSGFLGLSSVTGQSVIEIELKR